MTTKIQCASALYYISMDHYLDKIQKWKEFIQRMEKIENEISTQIHDECHKIEPDYTFLGECWDILKATQSEKEITELELEIIKEDFESNQNIKYLLN